MNTEQLKTDDAFEDKYINPIVDSILLYHSRQPIKRLSDFASQESKRAVGDALIDKDFIIYSLNQTWNYANEQLQNKDLGDIERDMYEKQKSKAKALMDKLDS